MITESEALALVGSKEPTVNMAKVLEKLAVEGEGQPDPASLPPAQGRTLSEANNRRWNVDLPRMDVTEHHLANGKGVKVRLFKPEKTNGLIIYVHGGGWCFGSLDSHERASRCLAQASNMAVLSVDYRLAPEHPYPAGLDDVVATLEGIEAFVKAQGLKGDVGIAGDSAGANLALAAMLRMADQQLPLPQFGLLFYGVYSADHTTPSHQQFGGGPGLTTRRMQQYWDWYAPQKSSRAHPFMAPVMASDDQLMAMPPLFLNAAGLDPLLSDTLALVDRLRALRDVDALSIHHGVVHGFMQMTTVLPEAHDAFKTAGEWIAGFIEGGRK